MPKGSYSNKGMSNRLIKAPLYGCVAQIKQLQESDLPVPKWMEDKKELAIFAKLGTIGDKEAGRLAHGVSPSVIKKLYR